MAWILLLTVMTSNQGSMTTIVFSDRTSCVQAGEKLKEEVNRHTPVFNNFIRYKCVKVSGVK